MSVHSGMARLNTAHKDLLDTWHRVRPSWRDQVGQAFDDEFIAPIEQQVRKATTVMQSLQEALHRAKSDCS